ncbi:MAG: metallophosphoesterase family protein [Thermomicrobiales bacterium]
MKLAFASDMHGNLPAFEAVLTEIEERGSFDAVIGGGDYAFNGIYPAECVRRIRALDWDCVRGNTDEWLVQAATDGEIPVRDCPPEQMHGPEMVERDKWAASQVEPDHVAWLAELPLDWSILGPSGQSLKFVHATPWSTHPPVGSDADESEKRKMLDEASVDVLLYGHIHDAYIEEIDGRTIACIGAVGLPFDGDPRPCFAIATDDGDGWTIEHVRVSYDNEAYARDVERSDLPGAEGVARIVRTGSQ